MVKTEASQPVEIARSLPPAPTAEVRSRMGRRELAVVAGGLLLVVVYASARVAGAGLAGLPALIGAGVPWLAVALGWWTYMAHGPRRSRTWLALAGGLSLWAAAAFYDLPLGGPAAPGEPVEDVLLSLGSNVLWMYALLCLRREIPVVPRIAGIIETVLIVCCGLTLAAYFVLEPGSQDSGAPLLFIHAISTLLLFGALVGFRYLVAGPLSRAQMLTLAAVGVALFSDGWHLRYAAGGQATPEALLVVTRVGTALVFSAAAYWTAFPPSGARRVNRWENLAPWLPMACLGTVISLPLLSYYGARALTPNIALGMFCCLALAVLRLGFALGENHHLRQERARLLWQNQEYIRLAISDPLTGLFNKGYYAYRLKIEFERSLAEQQPLTLIALDLDNFKQVNDRFGHAAGDRLLRDIGQVLSNGIRSVDLACRCGGDEFALILPRTTAEQGAILAERLRAAVAQVIARRGLGTLVSVSAGLAAFPQTAQTMDELPRQADVALYWSKQAGKNRATIYHPRP